MNICVYGVWHLGTVTAACLAEMGHAVVGFEENTAVMNALSQGIPPVAEPGIEALLKSGIEKGRLRFLTHPEESLREADVLWIAFDTPVDEDDRADVSSVVDAFGRILPWVKPGTLIVVSSQLPVGTTSRLEKIWADNRPGTDVLFAVIPENLRLGKAISAFLEPDRVVVGLRDEKGRDRVTELWKPLSPRIEWMSVESAEMTKHAINSFLATSVAFMNELASLCERSGADAVEVERGLKSESRIGPRAYLKPGGAISGGTLLRDLMFLSDIGRDVGVETPLLSGVLAANAAHKEWARRRLQRRWGHVAGKEVSLLGLTYKPGTNTLRRSAAVDFSLWLVGQGALVTAHDPAVRDLPPLLRDKIRLASTWKDLLTGADALVVTTEWPEFKAISAEEVFHRMKTPFVLDPGRFLSSTLGADRRLVYEGVGAIQ